DGRDERAGHGRLPDGKARLDGAMRAAGRAARVFKRVPVLGDISPFWVSEGGLEPPCPLRALAPQASASAYSATRTQLAAVWTGPSRITIANHGTWCEAQDSYRVNTAPTQPKEA